MAQLGLEVGDELTVKIIGLDHKGRIKLSRKPLLQQATVVGDGDSGESKKSRKG